MHHARRRSRPIPFVALALAAILAVPGVGATQDPSDLFRDARYGEAIERATELLSGGELTPAQAATAEVVRAASWLEEARLARRTARLTAEVLDAWYGRLLASGMGEGDPAQVRFHHALAQLRLGNATTAAASLSAIAGSGHALSARAATWERVARSLGAGEPLPAPGERIGHPDELLLAHLARGRVPLGVPAASASGDPRGITVVALLTWAGRPAPRGPLDPRVLTEPLGSAGRTGERDIPLRDPWLLDAYATACLDEARHALQGLTPGNPRLRSYAESVRGKTLLLAGEYGEAEAAFSRAGDEASTALAGLARALATGDPVTPSIVSEAAAGSPRATAEVVLAAAFEPVDVRGAAVEVSRALADWEDAFQVESAEFSLPDLRWGRWAAARLWWSAGDLEMAIAGLSAAYDPGRVGDHRANPPAWLPDWIAVMMQDVNNQTLVLRTTWEAAQALPMYRGVYDALQGYFVFTNVDPQKGVR